MDIARHGTDKVAAEAGRLCEGVNVSAVADPVCKTTPRADPQRAIRIHKQGTYEVVRQAIGTRERCDDSSANAVQPIGSADPEISTRRRCERKNDIARKTILHLQGFHSADRSSITGDGVKSASTRSHPKRSGVVLNDRSSGVGRESVPRTERTKAFIAQNVEPSGFSAHP